MTHEHSKPKPRNIRYPITLGIMACIVFSTLIALGFWQLQRRDWKNDLLVRLEYSLKNSPAPYPIPSSRQGEQSKEFLRVQLSGRYLYNRTIKFFIPTPPYARPYTQATFGFLLFTPFQFKDGIVLINRGFVPESMPVPVADHGFRSVAGLIRTSEQSGMFTPAPNLNDNIFFAADVAAMGRHLDLTQPNFIDAEYIELEPQAQDAPWPKKRDPGELLQIIPNRHLSYAITWFGLAVSLVIVFIAYIVKSRN